MELQCLVRFPADTDDFLRQAQAVITFGKQRALRGVYLCSVFTGEVYHCVAYLGGMNTFASGKEHPFGGEVYSGQVTRRQRENKCVRTNLVEYGRYDLIIRQDGMYKVFGRIGELGKGLFHFDLFGKVHKGTGRLQAGHPEGIELSPFGTGYVDTFVGYLEALVALVQQLQRFIKAELLLRSFPRGREALRQNGVAV